jgi:hypothetical protein
MSGLVGTARTGDDPDTLSVLTVGVRQGTPPALEPY